MNFLRGAPPQSSTPYYEPLLWFMIEHIVTLIKEKGITYDNFTFKCTTYIANGMLYRIPQTFLYLKKIIILTTK